MDDKLKVLMVLKAVETVAKAEYTKLSNEAVAIVQTIPSHKYICDLGKFSLKSNDAQITKVYTIEEQQQVDELQAKIDKLQAKIDKLGTTQTTKEAYTSLVYHKNDTALTLATKLLQNMLNNLNA